MLTQMKNDRKPNKRDLHSRKNGINEIYGRKKISSLPPQKYIHDVYFIIKYGCPIIVYIFKYIHSVRYIENDDDDDNI